MDASYAPSTAEYVDHLRKVAAQLVDRLLGDVQGVGEAGQIVLVILGVAVPLSLALVIIDQVRRSRRRRAGATLRVARPVPVAPVDPDQALALALAQGDARTALGALWRRLGLGLQAAGLGRWSPDQTEREFIATVHRAAPDWQGLGELEALREAVVVGVYGPHPPSLAAVQALVPRAEALVPPSTRTQP